MDPATQTSESVDEAKSSESSTPVMSKSEAPGQGGTDWKAMARKWEKLAKENSAAAKRLQELEDAQKTESQKQAEQIAKLEAANKAYRMAEERRGWARKIVGEEAYKGIPAEALRGDSEEDMREHANMLAGMLQPSEAARKMPPIPSATRQPAGVQNVPLSAQIAAAEKSGNVTEAIALKAMMLNPSTDQ